MDCLPSRPPPPARSSVEQLGRLQVYLITYVGVALLLSLWVLPGLVAALTPIRVREMFSLTRDALITAFVAGDLFIVLPTLIEASRTLVARHAPQANEAAELPDVLVPVSFNFPHTGKLLSLSFILFAGWFADAPMSLRDYPQLAVTGLLTFFGSLNAAVPFLLDLFRIPADTFQLFLGTGVINSRFGTLVAAVHTLVVAVLGTCAITGMAHVRKGPVLRYLAITALLTVAVIGGARALFAGYLRTEYSKDQVLAGMHLRRDQAPATVHRAPVAPDASESTAPLLQSIRERGVLRVGYMADSLPYLLLQCERGPCRAGHRAGASPGQRARRRSGVHARCEGADGRRTVEELLRHRDVRCRRHDPPRLTDPVFRRLPRRDVRLCRSGSLPRAVLQLG